MSKATRDLEGLACGQDVLDVLEIDDAAFDEPHAPLLDLPGLGHGGHDLLAQLARGVDRRVADHEGDAARVRAEIDRAEIRVGGDDAHVLDVHPELLGDDVAHDRVRALPDVVRAAEDRHEPGAVDLELDARLGHVVRVDRVVRPRDVHRAGDAEALSGGQLAVAGLPVGAALDLLEALHEAAGGDALAVDRLRARRGSSAADLDGVDAELFRHLVELALEGEARLHAVACFGPHGGLLVKTRVES